MTIISDRHSDAGEKELDGVAPLLPFLLNVCNLEKESFGCALIHHPLTKWPFSVLSLQLLYKMC